MVSTETHPFIQKPAVTQRRSVRLVFAFLTLVSVLVLLELGARLAGYRPWAPVRADIVVEPGQTFFKPHPSLGYSHYPGQFKLTLGGSYVFTATRGENLYRITHPVMQTPSDNGNKEEIWIFGDSVTYGWSVNDDESYPWLLQKEFPKYEVMNFGVSGYGTLHSLIQLKEELQKKRAPRIVVLAYASWHDPRILLSERDVRCCSIQTISDR